MSNHTSVMVITIVALVGLWMFITPFYDLFMKEFEFTPIASVIVGMIIIVVAYSIWRIRVI